VQADILISCGDLSHQIIFECAAISRPRHILAVKGNHDTTAPFPAPIVDLHLHVHQADGLRFGGFCGCWKYKPRGNFLFEQSEVADALRTFPPVDIFVAHNSPRLIHDQDDEVHNGFVAFTEYIQRANPRFFLHGHQHIHQETRLGLTRVAGTYRHRFIALPS
jgi:Icc-related predicted phosphoesterase